MKKNIISKKFKMTLLLWAAFMFVCFFSNNAFAKAFLDATPDNPYKISVIGDSISFEPSYATVLNENPCINVTTYAIGATQVAGKKNPESFVNRTKGKWFNADLILIMGGTNDYCGMNAMCNNLGDITSTDTNTFCGAYNTMINNIKNCNPGSKIAIITPIKRIGYTAPNIYGFTLANYVDASKMVAAGNGITCIDLYNDSECDFVTSHFLLSGNEIHSGGSSSYSSYLAKSNEYMIDGIHPTIEGHRVIGNTILKYIYSF